MPGCPVGRSLNRRDYARKSPRHHIFCSNLCLILLVTHALTVLGLSAQGQPISNAQPLSRGGELAHIWCATCHLFPEPDLIDKKTWKEQTLPRMKIRMGLSPESIEAHSEAALLKATGLFPEKPLIPAEDFQLIADYFIASAPEKPLPQGPHSEIVASTHPH